VHFRFVPVLGWLPHPHWRKSVEQVPRIPESTVVRFATAHDDRRENLILSDCERLLSVFAKELRTCCHSSKQRYLARSSAGTRLWRASPTPPIT
jgi:hypothetical protein